VRPVPRLDLPLALDRAAATPLHAQLAEALRRAVLDGHLPAGARLPSTRQAATEVGLARATVLAAYEQLAGEGYLEPRHGAGTFVSDHPSPVGAAPAPPRRAPHDDGAAPAGSGARPVDLRPGRPDTRRLVDPAWRAAWRGAASRVSSWEPPPLGLPALREQVAAHLRAARGVPASAEDVVITAGADEGLALVAHALALRDAVVEDPGYPSARRTLRRLGVALHPLPVDEHGLVVDALPEPGAAGAGVGAVLVTPSHQYPLGGVLPLARRLELLAWARARGAVVVEDDYDSEFRYGAAPLPALAGLDGDRVVHLGTLSKVLTPWLRTGYLLVPPALREAFAAVRRDLGAPVSGVQQQALATHLASGSLRRHVARTRRDCAHRRAHLLRALAAQPHLRAAETSAGLHSVVVLPGGADAADVVRRVGERGYLLADLADYAVQRRDLPPAVVLGYADASLADLSGAVAALAAACADRRPRVSTATTPTATARPSSTSAVQPRSRSRPGG